MLGLGLIAATTIVHLLLIVDVADHARVHLGRLLRRVVQKGGVWELLLMLLRVVFVR